MADDKRQRVTPAGCMLSPLMISKKRLKNIKQTSRRNEVGLTGYGGGGRKMKLLVMSSYLLDMVQSCDPCDPLPSVPSGQKYNVRSTGFRKIADDWIDPATRSGIESTYGPIANWDTSRVTSMNYLFNGKTTFNEDISKWDVSKVTDMEASTFSIHVISFHNDLSLKLSLLPFPHVFFFFCSKIFSLDLLLLFASLSLLFLTLQHLMELKHSTRTSRNGRCPK